MKRFLFLCIWLIVIDVRAAVPTFESFSTNQFQTNILQVFYRDPHTNDAGIIYPALANTLTLVTNENVYGTFSLPAKVTLLALGTNYLDVTTNTTWLLNSPTNDATQVTISLSAGAYQGQLLFVTSQNGSNSFTLPDLSEQWDVPGAYVDIQGDWVGTTNRGIILQYTAPDWIEMARFDPGQTGGGTVFGSGTVPNFPYWITPTTLGTSSLVYSNNNNIRLDSTNTVDSAKFLIQGPSGVAYMDVDGTGQVAHFQGGSVTAWFANNNQRGIIAFDTVLAPSVNNTIDLGNPTGLRWKNFALDGHISWNGSTNSLFDTWGAGTPEGSVTARPGSIYRDTDAGEIYKKATGTGAAGWIALSSGAASALWASTSSILQPSPAIDLVRIESQLADNATNVAFIVDTSVPWGNGTALARYANAGTNVAVIGSRGELYLGAGGVASFPQSFDSIFSYNDESLDGLTANRMFLGTRDSSGYNYYGEVQISSGISSTNSPDSGIALQSLGADSSYGTGGISVSSIDQFIYLSNQLNLHPTVSSTGSATAYTFDTANVLTNGDATVTFANAGTPYIYAGPGGSPALSVTSLAEDNATNVALVVDTAVPWTANYLAKFNQAGTNVFKFGTSGDLQINTPFAAEVAGQMTDGSGHYFDLFADATQLFFDLSGFTYFNPLVASTGSATAYVFDTAALLQSGDLIGAFGNAGTNVLSINSDGGILSGRGITTVDEAYSFRSSHNQALGDSQYNNLYLEDTTSGNYTNWAAANISTLANSGGPATASNFLMDVATATKNAEFEVALNASSTTSTNSLIRFKNDGVVKFQVDYRGILTTAPPTDTAQFWQFGSEAVISTVTNLIVSVNGVKYSIPASPR